ncbi:MAG: serine protease [Rhodothermaceae bacterium]|nr:serine protease [Rhodothermaceae bacterium]
MLHRLLLLALVSVPLLAGPKAQTQEDPYRLVLFSTPDRTVAAVGETITVTVEGLAVPETDEAALTLLHAFNRIAFPPGTERDFAVVHAEDPAARRRAGTRILELSRRFEVQPRHAGVLMVPPLPVQLEGAVVATRPQEVRVYENDPSLTAARSAVVPLVAESRGASRTTTLRRIGSGFFIAEDALVTAYHVVLGADRVRLQLPDGRRVTTGRVWAIDPARDVVVLHVNPAPVRRAGITPLTLTERFDADLLHEDEADRITFTAGWPGGIQQPTTGWQHPSLRFGPADVLRVTANAVRPGDSGGPLLNAQGRVLGVVASGRSTQNERDVLREDLCLATDPRRALADRLAQPSPRSLRHALQEAAQEAPNATVLRAASLLNARMRAEEVEQHLKVLTDAVGAAPDDVALQFLAGSVLQAYGEADQAALAYQAALAEASDYFPALYALGHVYYQRGELGEAERLFEQTRSFAPYARLGALGLARVFTAQLRYEQAAEVLIEVLDRDPHYAPALYLLGYGLLARGRVEEAEALAVRLDRTAPAWADVLRLHLREDLLRPTVLAALPRIRPFREQP